MNFAIKASALRRMLASLGNLSDESVDTGSRLDDKALGRAAMAVAAKVLCYEDKLESLLK